MAFECGEQIKEVVSHLIVDLVLRKEASGLNVLVPCRVSQIGRANVGAYSPPPYHLGMVMLDETADEVGRLPSQEAG
jgi:hypothetical protein